MQLTIAGWGTEHAPSGTMKPYSLLSETTFKKSL